MTLSIHSAGALIRTVLSQVSTISAYGLLALLSSNVRAQTFQEAWVSPEGGSDSTGVVGTPNHPFRTIQAAINTVATYVSLPQVQGLVHALPGLYSDLPLPPPGGSGNGEQFPIIMVEGVHVVGYGAKECVIRKAQYGTSQMRVFIPDCPGYRDLEDVVINMSVGNNVETLLQGFTLQGGIVQVSVYPPEGGSSKGRISNCVFDMRASFGAPIQRGPWFGILITPISTLGDLDSDYGVITFNIFNNTFIQGWIGGDGDELADYRAVGICDVNENQDPHVNGWIQRGVSPLNIQNNLFRHLPAAFHAKDRAAFAGIGYSDTSVAATPVQGGTTTGPTNAFDPTAASPWCSALVNDTPAQPRVVIDGPGATDPGFVGEMISQQQAVQLTNKYLRDWRLLPDSSVVDQGTTPISDGLGNRRLIAVDGTQYLEPPNWPISSFTWDGEGHGNPRTVGLETDIGVDESDRMLVAGDYGNDSKSHNTPFHPSIEAGNVRRTYIFKQLSGAVTDYSTMAPYNALTAWTIPPGTTSGTTLGGLGMFYLQQSIVQTTPLGNIANVGWVNPLDPPLSPTHYFGELVFSDGGDNNQLPRHLNQQVRISGGSVDYTNLQSEIY